MYALFYVITLKKNPKLSSLMQRYITLTPKSKQYHIYFFYCLGFIVPEGATFSMAFSNEPKTLLMKILGL
jgi:hypothetical protein